MTHLSIENHRNSFFNLQSAQYDNICSNKNLKLDRTTGTTSHKKQIRARCQRQPSAPSDPRHTNILSRAGLCLMAKPSNNEARGLLTFEACLGLQLNYPDACSNLNTRSRHCLGMRLSAPSPPRKRSARRRRSSSWPPFACR